MQPAREDLSRWSQNRLCYWGKLNVDHRIGRKRQSGGPVDIPKSTDLTLRIVIIFEKSFPDDRHRPTMIASRGATSSQAIPMPLGTSPEWSELALFLSKCGIQRRHAHYRSVQWRDRSGRHRTSADSHRPQGPPVSEQEFPPESAQDSLAPTLQKP